MFELGVELELASIESATPQSIGYDGDAVITMRCTLTKECASRLENEVLTDLRERSLADAGIGNLADYISHIGRREFNRQLAAMGYIAVLTKEKSAELFEMVERH